MIKDDLLNKIAKVKAEIQGIQLWIDDARTNRIARIRYQKTKDRLQELFREYKRFFKEVERLLVQKWEEVRLKQVENK